MTPFKRIALLWLLVLALFGVFNAVFWPVYAHQQRVAPSNFLAHAQAMAESGDTEAAIARLRTGLHQFRPPAPAPYAALRDLYAAEGDTASVDILEPFVTFYRGLQGPAAARAAHWRTATEQFLEHQPAPTLRPYTTASVRTFAGEVAARYGVADAVAAFPPPHKLTLLRLLGGVIREDGQIGNTGVSLPSDVLVMSWAVQRGIARIHVGERAYVGRERGLHVVLISTEEGTPLDHGVFDLWAEPREAERLVAYLRNVPEGMAAAFAVYDEASVFLTPEASAALEGFGLGRTAWVNHGLALFGLGYSFAALGVQGAAPGTGQQVWSPRSFDGAAGHPVVCGTVHGGGPA